MHDVPAKHGWRMPAEWEPHLATWIAWPHNQDDWPGKFGPIPWVYAEIVRHLHRSEQVHILVSGPSQEDQARQEELLQAYRKAVVQAFADVDNALYSIRQTTERLRLQREVVAASRRAFELAEQQLRAGTADIVTVLNTQTTLFQAEDLLTQAQLARFLAIVSLYQALGGGWEPRLERPVNAL